MKVYQITCGLKQQNNYQNLFSRINDCGYWCHPLESTWIITSTDSALQIRDRLAPALNHQDAIVVTRLQGEVAWQQLNKEVSIWLQQQLMDVEV